MSYTFADTQDFGQPPPAGLLTPREAGELAADLLAAQVTGATGIPTSKETILSRIRQTMERKETCNDWYPATTPGGSETCAYYSYDLPSRDDAIMLLSGVYRTPGGDITPAAAAMQQAAGPGWASALGTITRVASATGIDKVVISAVRQFGTQAAQSLMSAITGSGTAFAQFSQQIAAVASKVQSALPVLGAFYAAGSALLEMISGAMRKVALHKVHPQQFAVEPVAIYAFGKGISADSFPAAEIRFNPAFWEVFALGLDKYYPSRVLDLEDFRGVLLSSKVRSWIANGSNKDCQIQTRPYEEAFGCTCRFSLMPLNNMYVGREARGAFVAASYLFGNTACVQNAGYPGSQSKYFNLGRGCPRTDSASASGIWTGNRTTGWFSKTDNDGTTWIHPPVEILPEHLNQRGAWNLDKVRPHVLNKILPKSDKWIKLGQEPSLGPEFDVPKPSAVAKAEIQVQEIPPSTPTAQRRTVVRVKLFRQAPSAARRTSVKAQTPAGVSTKTKVVIGVGIGVGVAALGVGGYVLYRKKRGK